jgi:hypothetical protein
MKAYNETHFHVLPLSLGADGLADGEPHFGGSGMRTLTRLVSQSPALTEILAQLVHLYSSGGVSLNQSA